MRRMEKITGRSDDMMIIRGVNVFPTQVEELILQQEALAPHYQLEITRPKVLDELTVLVERAPGAGGADGEAAGVKLAHHDQEPDRRQRQRCGWCKAAASNARWARLNASSTRGQRLEFRRR